MAILPHTSTRTLLITTGVVTAVGAVVYLVSFRAVVAFVRRPVEMWRMAKKIMSVTGSVFSFPFKLLRAEDDGSAADGALVLRDIDAATEPRAAMQAALDAIRDGHLTTLGGLVFFLRGLPTAPFAAAAATTTTTTAATATTTAAAAPVKATTSNGAAAPAAASTTATAAADQHKVRNEHRLGVPLMFVQFVQESYLPATSNNSNNNNKSSDHASCARVERAMFEQLVHASNTLRRLDAERATAFDDGNATHINLLQQLWAATGRPASTYQRISPLWQQLGFQGNDPTSDLRGGGVFALRQFVDFAQTHTAAFRDAMAYNKRVHDAGTDVWFMLAVVSVQLSTQLLLQREFALARPHLEVVYDMVHEAADDNSSGSSSSGGGGNKTAVLSRADLAYRVYHTTLTACSDARLTATAAAAAAATPATTTATQPHRSSNKDGDKASADVQNRGNSNNKKSKEGGNDDDAAALAQLWTQHMCDVEVGLNMLHHALLLYFIQSWERDKPRVADYNTYTVEHVFATFFTPTWSLSTDTTPTTATTGTSSV